VNQVFFDRAAACRCLAFEGEVFDVVLAILREDEVEAPLRGPDLARQPIAIPDKYAGHEGSIGR
jgi:hypothetical protein